MLCRCTLTVPSEIESRSAMPRLRRPSPAMRTISSSRGVSASAARRACVLTLKDRSQCSRRHVAIDPLEPFVHLPDTVQQGIGRRFLQHDTRYAELHRFDELFVQDVGGQQHRTARPGVRLPSSEADPGRFDRACADRAPGHPAYWIRTPASALSVSVNDASTVKIGLTLEQ